MNCPWFDKCKGPNTEELFTLLEVRKAIEAEKLSAIVCERVLWKLTRAKYEVPVPTDVTYKRKERSFA